MKKALITGITGQDGSYLAELLIKKGYEVHGVKRRTSQFNTRRIDHLYQDPHIPNRNFILHYGDLSDSNNLTRIIESIKPDEIYNLAAQSHVAVSFDSPEYTADIDALGTLRILEAIRVLGLNKKTKFYQASTSELYGLVRESPQNEQTAFYPRSPYAVAKLYSYWITINYREAYGIFACNGILFNHESKRRGETFVTRKITRTLSRITLGIEDCLYLGNLNAMRDWGHAKDYVEMQWLMLQQGEPDDFVIATGQQISVRKFVEKTLSNLNIKVAWKGKNEEEIGIVEDLERSESSSLKKGDIIVRVDPKYYRPTETENLLGDASKARKILNWSPKISIDSLVEEMVKHDLDQAKRILNLKKHGFKIDNDQSQDF